MMPSALDRVRQAARKDRKAKFTALLHHVTIDQLRAAFGTLSRRAAAGVDGVTWADYAEGLEARLVDLHGRLHRRRVPGQALASRLHPEAGRSTATARDRRSAQNRDPAPVALGEDAVGEATIARVERIEQGASPRGPSRRPQGRSCRAVALGWAKTCRSGLWVGRQLQELRRRDRPGDGRSPKGPPPDSRQRRRGIAGGCGSWPGGVQNAFTANWASALAHVGQPCAARRDCLTAHEWHPWDRRVKALRTLDHRCEATLGRACGRREGVASMCVLAMTATISRLNAGMSSGLRLVTRRPSTTTS